MLAILLNDNRITLFDLYRYKIVVVTYNYVIAEYNRVIKFDKRIEEY